MATATVSYKAELSDLRAKLASITDITRAEARKMVSELSKSMRALEKAQERATRSARGYSGSARGAAGSANQLALAGRSVAQQLPDVISQLASGTSAAQVFAQQGLQVVQQNMGLVLSTAARLGPAVGVAAAAIAAGAVVYQQAARELNREAEAAEFVRRTNESLEPTIRRVEDAQLDLQHATGLLTDAQLRQAKAQLVAQRAVEDFGKAQREEKDRLNESIEGATRWRDALDSVVVSWHPLGMAVEAGADAIFGWSQTIEDAQGQLQGLGQAVQEEAEAQRELRTLLEQVTAAEEGNRASKEGRGRASRDAAQADREAAEAARERAAASAELVSIQQGAQLAILDGEARINEEYRRQMVAIAELQAVSEDRAAADAARAATREEYELELWSLRRERARQEADEEKRLSQEVAQARLRHEQMVTQARQKAADNWMQATQVATQALAQSFEEGSAAALAFYTVSQAVAAAQAIVHGIQASMAALAPPPLGLGPVAGIPLAASTKALGIAQAAAIMGTTVAGFADTPGLQRAGPGGMTASFVPGDLVVAGRDEGDLVRQMQRAGIGMGGGSQVLIRDADRHHGRYGRDPMRAPDRYQPVRRRAGRVPGRR